MKAIVYQRDGSRHVLKLEEVERPTPADHEILIKVRAASVNPIDYHLLKHSLLRRVMSAVSKVDFTRPGRDLAGEVEAVGKNVTQFKPRDNVFGTCSGAFAEYACAGESAFAMKPDQVSFEQGASVPVAGLTALQALRDKAKIQPGQKVLINGAAGGVGTFAVQIAKSFGAEVTGVCSTRNVDLVRSIGADHVIDYTQEDFTASGEHYDVIFDLVVNHSFSDHRRVLTSKGIYVGGGALGIDSMIGILTATITQFALSPFVSQKFTNILAKLNQVDLRILGELIKVGKITPVIERRFSLSETAAAVSHVEGKHARGKVIVEVAPA